MTTPALTPMYTQDDIDAAIASERERICEAIKAEDDHCADGDYMMDSDDCIKVVRYSFSDYNITFRAVPKVNKEGSAVIAVEAGVSF